MKEAGLTYSFLLRDRLTQVDRFEGAQRVV
jgi:hypothetical protein